jgi:hypothetical protein
MDLKKIKLALTVDLMNHPTSFQPVKFAKAAMRHFQVEAGSFRRWSVKHSRSINEILEQQTLELEYEHCTLNLDLVKNRSSRIRSFQGFELKLN